MSVDCGNLALFRRENLPTSPSQKAKKKWPPTPVSVVSEVSDFLLSALSPSSLTFC
jgi:hypothetical protein